MADKSPLQIIREELPQFWQGEQAAGMRGMVKGLGDLLGISSSTEPESVMSRYPSEENAVRSLTPVIAAAAPAARAAAPLARLATRNPLTTGAALTYATEDPTMMLMNPASVLASYTPEAEAVVKPKGGNWLSSVENALKGLKSNQMFSGTLKDLTDELTTYRPGTESYDRVLREIGLSQRNNAINDWVGGPLTKYVKTYMGTAEDPVRKLAEQGILHVNPEELNIRPDWRPSGTQKVLSISPEARAWEGASDLVINPMRRKDLSLNAELGNPWVDKLGPEDPVYGLIDQQHVSQDLGFRHLKDELHNAISPISELPASLQLKPEDLKQMGMEKAVRHVAAINAWRDAKQAEADLAKSMNPATHVVKEYPEGYKLVELAPPKASGDLKLTFEETPQGTRVFDEAGNRINHPGGYNLFKSPEEATKILSENQNRKALEEALKYEGDTMGHCVGGYCEGVSRGDSRIFSIRDAKGRPHVTIEVRPANRDEFIQNNYKDYRDMLNEGPEFANAWVDRQLVKSPQKIVQIKGKGNKAPSEKYQPMVQDFIRSQEWSDIGDLGNSGLVDISAFPKRVEALGSKYVTEKELTDYLDQFESIPKYAQGGSVQPAHFDDLSAFLSR